MEKLNNKGMFLCEDSFVFIEYLKDSKSGRIKKGQRSRVSKTNANYLIKYKIAIIV